jgi:hypothetical protein
MPVSRYERAPILGLGFRYGTSYAIPAIRENITNGNIKFDVITLTENTRLDILAGQIYGDGRLFWVIAAASNVGWTCQAPPGTLIRIPVLTDVLRYIG